MASQGPIFPGTASSTPDGSGMDDSWSDPGNICADDSLVATCILSSAGHSSYLRGNNFGFTIPGGSTINGIEVNIKRQYAGAGGVVTDTGIRLRVTAGSVGSTKTIGDWPFAGFSVSSFGGVADLWGTTWSDSDFNSDFGVDIQCYESSSINTAIAQVDYVTITIYYTSSGGAGVAKRSVVAVCG